MKLPEALVNDPTGEHGGVAGFPQHRASHHGGRSGEITSDGCEVERSDRGDETLQASQKHRVHRLGSVDRFVL